MLFDRWRKKSKAEQEQNQEPIQQQNTQSEKNEAEKAKEAELEQARIWAAIEASQRQAEEIERQAALRKNGTFQSEESMRQAAEEAAAAEQEVKLANEKAAAEQAEKLAAEKAAAEQAAKLAAEKAAAEQAAKVAAEKAAAEQAAKLAAEKAAAEQAAKLAAEKAAAEQATKLAAEKAAAEKAAAEEAAKVQAAKAAAEKAAAEQAAKLAAEKAAAEQAAKLAAEKAAAEQAAKLAAEKAAKEQAAKAAAEKTKSVPEEDDYLKQQQEKIRLFREQQEQERLAREAAKKPHTEETADTSEEKKSGLFSRLKQGLFKSREHMSPALDAALEKGRKLDEDFYDDLMDALIMSDMGVPCAEQAIEQLRTEIKEKKLQTTAEAQEALKAILVKMLDVPRQPLKWPMVILMVGVNGVGKTTTIGKLGLRFQGLGRTVMLCAADTFRAAAADQLQVWAERAHCPLIRHKEGADPAGVVFDGIEAAKAKNADLLIVDTAGRLHNKKNLMEEMQKIRRVIDQNYPEAEIRCLLVVDATTGQNGLQQALAFREAAGINGVVLTKMDGTAKGGVAFPIVRELGVPVRYIGVGEGIEDLQSFHAEDFVRALIDREDA